MKRFSRTTPVAARASTLAAVGAGLLSLGLGVGAYLLPMGPYLGEPAVAQGPAGTLVPVTATTTRDAVAVTVEVNTSPAKRLAAPVGGTLTATACRVGASITSGRVLVSVDNQPVGALHTTVPLWRDIRVGTHGADVRAVTTELRRLGAPVSAVSTFDAATAATVRGFLDRRGFGLGSPVLPRDRLVWLPEPQVVAASCDATLGDAVASGAPLATLRRPVDSLTVLVTSSGKLTGERELEVGGTRVAVPRDGVIVDGKAIRSVLSSGPGLEYLHGKADGTIAAEYVLSEPVDVLAIPPGALIDASAAQPCVRTATGQSVPVEVVANALGQVLVRLTVAGTPPPAEIRLDTQGTLTCR